MKASRSVRYLWLAALVLGEAFAAGIPGRYDPSAVALLPRYCIYTQGYREYVPGGNNPEEIKRWYSVMGQAFHAMHHYCWGLVDTNNAIFHARNSRERQALLLGSVREFDYVIKNTPPDFVLLPEILTKKGENLIRMGQAAPGLLALQQAIQLKPDYWPPYVQMSDYFKGVGDLKKARALLEEGLARTPDSKTLQQRLAEIKSGKDNRNTAPPAAKSPPPAKP